MIADNPGDSGDNSYFEGRLTEEELLREERGGMVVVTLLFGSLVSGVVGLFVGWLLWG